MKDESRREFIKNTIHGVGVATVGGLAVNVIWNALHHSPEVGEVERDALELLFDKSSIPILCAGGGNALGLLDNGEQKLSSYLEYSSGNFSTYIQKAFNLTAKKCNDNTGKEFLYNPNMSALFLGGPVANDVVKKLLGYEDVSVDRNGIQTNMPMPIMENKTTRWAQQHGISGYGIYENGNTLKAKRYDGGKLVVRDVYRLIDKQDNSPLIPEINSAGFLENEWLTIVKLKEKTTGTTQVVIGGMHGYSTEAFARNITKNLENLARKVGKYEQYQVVVGVDLKHATDLNGDFVTHGEINWDTAKIHKIG